MARVVAILFFQCIALTLLSQKHANNWAFGNGAGINFNVSPPQTFTNALNIFNYQSASGWSDSNGNIVLYTNANSVWNSSHSLVANGTGMGSQVRQHVVVPLPGSQNIYYIFSCGGANAGFQYSIVDMSLASGQGSVTTKAFQVSPGVQMQQQIAAIPHCNGTDVWIITRRTQSGDFRVWLFSSSGLNTTPVVSNTPFIASGTSSLLKCSPDGNLIASNENGTFFLRLHSFNKLTGAVTNAFPLATNATNMDFSPDGSKLYCLNNNTGSTITILNQWNLCAGSQTAIAASIYTQTLGANILNMQLAPNGIIYLGTSSVVTVIHALLNPNNSGAACNYSTAVITLTNATTSTFPTFMNGFISQNPPGNSLPSFSFQPINNLGCFTEQFFVPPSVFSSTIGGSCSSSYSVSGIRWNFGDPLSGPSNTSTVNNPIHAYPANGIYTVSLIVDYYCGGGSDTITQVVNVNAPCVTVTSNSITCASLGTATVNANGGIGPFSYTWFPVSQTGSVASGLNPGTHTVYLHDAGNNITSTATVVFLSPVLLTGSLVASPSVMCHGANNGTASITNIAGGSSSQNYLWSNGSSTFSTSNVTALTAGTWSVTVTDGLTACALHSVFVISQPPALTLQITAPGPFACLQSLTTLTGTASGGVPFSTNSYSFTWANGPSVSNTNVATYSALQSSSSVINYSLTVVDFNGCQQVSSYSITFVPTLTLSTVSTSICPFSIGTISVSGANSYTWSSSVTSFSMADSPSVSTVYTVTGEAPGCISSTTAQIVLKPVPLPALSSNAPPCVGASIVLQAGTPGVSFVWTGPLSFMSTSATPTVTNLGLVHSGVYNLTLSAANGCTATASLPLTVNLTPTLSVLGSTVCNGQQGSLTANSVQNATYLWTGTSFQSTQQNPTFLNSQIGQTGSYSVIVVSPQGCTHAAVAHLLVVSVPALNVSLSSTSLCAQALNGSPNTITFTSNGANSYTLFTPDLTGSGNPAGPSTTVSTMPPYSSTLVLGTATIVGSNGVCTNSVTRNYSVIPNPTVVITPTPVICAGENYTYTSFGASSYVWTSSTPNFTTYNNGGVAVAHPSINSVFSVFGTSLGCNSASQTSTINVIPLPVINLIPQEPIICLHEKITLTANGTGTSFQWFPEEGLNSTVGMSVITSPLQTKNYTVIASANNCTNTANITVTVLALPQPTIINSKEKLCVNETIILKGEGGKIYDWSGPQNLFYSGQEINFKAASVHFSGDFTLTATDENGCKGSTATSIVIQTLPQGYLGGLKENVCVPYCGDFNFSGTLLNSELTSAWKIGNQIISNNKFSHCFSEAGTYTIAGRIFDTKTTCSNSVSYQIKVHSKPQADFYFSPQNPVEGIDEVVFTNASVGEEQNKWNWFIHDEFKSKFESQNISYKFDNSGLYTIAMVVSNKWNCTDTAVRTIQVETDFGMYIPNAFTPNGDGLNDEFKPVIKSASKYNLKIFDRWGHLIFESSEIEKGWDGTNRGGVNSKGGVYAWRIEVTPDSHRELQGESKAISGHVTLLR